jgi:hypothetical protein
MLSGDIAVAKTILRDYINATVGFSGLAQATHIPPKKPDAHVWPRRQPARTKSF